MDNLQFWLYVIVAVIYLVAQSRKKAKKAPQRPRREERPAPSTRTPTGRTTTNPPRSPKTFEELLREITESKQQPPVVQPREEYVDYDEVIEEEASRRQLEDANKKYNDDRVFDIYEEAKREAFHRPSLEESPESQAPSTYNRFKEFDLSEEKGILAEYAETLKNPDGFKKALILSELLNRKHF